MTQGQPAEGLMLVNDYLNANRQGRLLATIDSQPWRTDLKRRVQHYGWRYDYRSRRVSPDDDLGPLPPWLEHEARRLAENGWFDATPTQAIVNEYMPGQGIASHIDCEPCFGDVVASLSLGGRVIMDFHSRQTGEQLALPLEPGALLILSGPARYEWTHGIAARRTDVIEGHRTQRDRRVSVTFRTVTL